MDFSVTGKFGIGRFAIRSLCDCSEARGLQTMLQVFKIVARTVFVFLMKYVTQNVHASWEVIRKWYREFQLLEAIQIGSQIGLDVPSRVRNDDSDNSSRLKHPKAIRQEARQFFPYFQVLDKLFGTNSDGTLISQRQTSPAIPSYDVG